MHGRRYGEALFGYPARQDKQQHLPGMQNRFHADSGFIFLKITESGILKF
jgi:hypothetical protein